MFRSDRLESLMAERHVSQSELARRVGVTQATIWKLLKDPPQGSKHTPKLASVLGSTSEYLMGDSDEREAGGAAFHFDSEEREWLDILAGLPPKDRQALLHIARSMATSAASPLIHSRGSGYKAG